jgi:hypothetical protein
MASAQSIELESKQPENTKTSLADRLRDLAGTLRDVKLSVNTECTFPSGEKDIISTFRYLYTDIFSTRNAKRNIAFTGI